MVERVSFDIIRLRTLPVHRAFHVTTKQHHARTVKQRSVFLQNIKGINTANVRQRQSPASSSKFDQTGIRGIIEPLDDNSQFEYDLSHMVKTLS